MPPLRERKDDIVLFARAFLKEASQRLGRSFEAIPRRVLETLESYDWPGNVRELQNLIERAAVTSSGPELQLPEEWQPRTQLEADSSASVAAGLSSQLTSHDATIEELERAHILRVLVQTHWRVEGPKGAAVKLGLHPSTLRSRMQKLGIGKTGTTDA